MYEYLYFQTLYEEMLQTWLAILINISESVLTSLHYLVHTESHSTIYLFLNPRLYSFQMIS